jgi:hypothetical protein
MVVPGSAEAWLDEQRCVQVLNRYATAVDQVDLELLRSCFAEDVEASYMGRPPTKGVEAVVAVIAPLAQLRGTVHNLGPVHASLTDEGARLSAGCLVLAVSPGRGGLDALGVLRAVRYRCDLARLAGDWKITRLEHSMLWATAAPESGPTGEPLTTRPGSPFASTAQLDARGDDASDLE